MDKPVVSVGNSVAVIIERALCRMLDIRRGSRVRVSTDGQRIVIEPVREEKRLAPLELVGMAQIIQTLVYSDIPHEAITALHPGLDGRRAHVRLKIWGESLRADARELDQVYARRFRVCFGKRRAGATWAAAVAAALAAEPGAAAEPGDAASA
jgi:antitoxin component of MazEF toxin-antitoxin module